MTVDRHPCNTDRSQTWENGECAYEVREVQVHTYSQVIITLFFQGGKKEEILFKLFKPDKIFKCLYCQFYSRPPLTPKTLRASLVM